jgi:hypothetical protein
MIQDTGDKVKAIKNLVMQMNDFNDARLLILTTIGNDRQEMLRLKRDMGAALRPILGNCNGYYVLDLSKEMDRMCVVRLLEISATFGEKRGMNCKLGINREGDVSQHGNWSSFRNEVYEGQPIIITAAFCSPVPTSGKLSFDFSGGGRPTKDALFQSDIRIVKTLIQHHLLDPKDASTAIYKLSRLKNNMIPTLACDGHTYYECPMDRMRLIGECIERFYEKNLDRSKHFLKTKAFESSTDVDPNGKLIEVLERDPFQVSTHIGTYVLHESEMIARKLKEAKEAKMLKKQAAAAELARKQAFGFVSKSPQRNRSESSSGSDSDSDR